jgi:hypothetical protein
MSTREEAIKALAKDLEKTCVIHLLAEWIAIENDESSLQAETFMEHAQELHDYLNIIGYRLLPTELKVLSLKEQIWALQDAAPEDFDWSTPSESEKKQHEALLKAQVADCLKQIREET